MPAPDATPQSIRGWQCSRRGHSTVTHDPCCGTMRDKVHNRGALFDGALNPADRALPAAVTSAPVVQDPGASRQPRACGPSGRGLDQQGRGQRRPAIRPGEEGRWTRDCMRSGGGAKPRSTAGCRSRARDRRAGRPPGLQLDHGRPAARADRLPVRADDDAGDQRRGRCDRDRAPALARARHHHEAAGCRRLGHPLPDDQHAGRRRGAGPGLPLCAARPAQRRPDPGDDGPRARPTSRKPTGS